MVAGDNLLSMSQNYFSPDIVQKFSEQIGQSLEKTKAGLKSVIPTFLCEVINKGSTPEGADSIVNMVNTHNYEAASQLDASKINEGAEVVDNIFGGKLNSVVAKLNSSTGLDNSSIKKMMSLAAPGLMGFIANKVKSEKLGSSGLMSFLSSQKGALSALSAGAAGLTGFAGDKVGSFQQQIVAKKTPWMKIAFAVLILLGLLFWWLGSRWKIPTTTQTITTKAVTTEIPSVNELGAFLASGSVAELPKHFRFETLTFARGSASLEKGSEIELNRIANALNANKSATVRIEGYTDNVGAADMNKKAFCSTSEYRKDGARGQRNCYCENLCRRYGRR